MAMSVFLVLAFIAGVMFGIILMGVLRMLSEEDSDETE